MGVRPPCWRGRRSPSCASTSTRRASSWATRVRCSSATPGVISVQGCSRAPRPWRLSSRSSCSACPSSTSSSSSSGAGARGCPSTAAARTMSITTSFLVVGYSQRKAVLLLYGWCVLLSGLAVAMREQALWASLVLGAAALIATVSMLACCAASALAPKSGAPRGPRERASAPDARARPRRSARRQGSPGNRTAAGLRRAPMAAVHGGCRSLEAGRTSVGRGT